jgi:hypothetical protein
MERENEFCASGLPSDRQEKEREGEKSEENIRKNGMKTV